MIMLAERARQYVWAASPNRLHCFGAVRFGYGPNKLKSRLFGPWLQRVELVNIFVVGACISRDSR
jgi:hypothetical protein